MLIKKRFHFTWKKILAFAVLTLGMLLPGVKGKQIVKDDAGELKTKASQSNKNEQDVNTFTSEEQYKEIENRLKGLGYFN